MPTNSSQKTRAAKRIQMTYRKKRNRNVDLSDMIFNSDYVELERALQNGANPNGLMPNNNEYFSGYTGYNFLCMATIYTELKCVELLLKYGANPNYNQKKEYPLLLWDQDAYMNDDYTDDNVLDVVEMLLLSGANPNIIDHKDKTPLTYAFELQGTSRGASDRPDLDSNGKDIIELLLRYGADPRKKNNSGVNALMEIDDIVMEDPPYCRNIQKLLHDKANILDEMDRLALELSKRRLALMKTMEYGRDGPMSSIRYETGLMEHISKYM